MILFKVSGEMTRFLAIGTMICWQEMKALIRSQEAREAIQSTDDKAMIGCLAIGVAICSSVAKAWIS